MPKHVRGNCGILSISSILSYKRGTTPTKSDGKWRHINLIWEYSKTESYAKFQLNMSKHEREKCGKLYISSFSVPKGALLLQKLTQTDDTRTWCVVWWNKVICKISAQYVKACKRKVRKTLYFQYSMFQKGHNSYKNWRHSNLLCSTVKQVHMQNFSSICQSM